MPTTVVIIDDHPSFRASARAILQAEGFEVVGEAEDGESGIAAARALAPDVLLLDVQLPDMDGFAVCRELGLNGGPPAVVLVSSRDASDYGELIEQSGARGFIPKAELGRDCTGRSARMRTRTLVLVALGGLALAAFGTALVLASDHAENTAAFLSLALTVGLSFLVSGVIALWRRPDNRTGFLLVLVAYFWFLGALAESDNDWVFTLGVLVSSLALGAFVHLLLAYPTGRLQGRRDLWLVVGTYVARPRRLPRAAAGRRAARLELPHLHEHDRRHQQRHGAHARPQRRQRRSPLHS